jgi:hypothetical protein
MSTRDTETPPREVPLVRIFLSSPGDVAEERTLARQLIDAELPKLRFLSGRLALELIAWRRQGHAQWDRPFICRRVLCGGSWNNN